jgi:hypothetical protein
MKPIITLVLLCFFTNQISSQQIVVQDKQWEGNEAVNPLNNFNAKFRAETKVINDEIYNELLFKVEEGWFEGVKQYYREENNKVYRLYQNEERVIYDFTLNVGDTILISDDNNQQYKFFPIRTVDTTIFNNVLRKLEMRVILEGSQTVSSEKHVWIEGVGDTGFFFGFGEVYNNQNATPINCVRDNSVFYSAGSQCPIISAVEDIPIVPEILYDSYAKLLLIKSDDVQRVILYDMSGSLIRSFDIDDTIQELDLNSINTQICVVVYYSKTSYSSKIIKL